MARDYYEVLGLGRKCTPQDIKQAFRKLARQYHPDVTGNDAAATERFKEISEAYEVLSDPKKRRRYDLFGHPHQHPGPSKIYPNPLEKMQDFIEQLGQIFRPQASDPCPGIDVEIEENISFQEAYEGAKKRIQITLPRPCGICEGKGHIARASPHPCPDCGGTGKSSPFEFLPLGLKCQSCQGIGAISNGPCRGCHGQGKRIEKDDLWVQFPPGIDHGSRIRLHGRGQAGTHGGPAGDLYIVVRLEQDPRFSRRGQQIRTEVRIPLRDALLGGDVVVPLPAGSVRLKIPAGTQGGQIFRLRNRGFPSPTEKERADFWVKVQIDIPDNLSREERSWAENL